MQVPVGRETLGRIMNVIGEPVDECGPISEHMEHLPQSVVLASCRCSATTHFVRADWRIFAVAADAKHHWPIHREAPAFVEQSTEQEILVTGIKVCRPL